MELNKYVTKQFKKIGMGLIIAMFLLAGNASAGPITIIGDATQLWNKTISSGNIYGYLSDDLNGDNKADVIITTQICAAGTCTYTASAVRGYDGVDLWSKTISGSSVSMWASSAGDLNGDNKADVIITNYSWISGTATYTTSAVRGYDGLELWNKSSSGWMRVTSAGDLNGDNKADVIIITYNSGAATYTTSAVRGYDGVELWSKTISGSNLWVEAGGAGDLNGDNKADVIITTQICVAGTCTYTASAVRGYDGVELWNKSSSVWMPANPAGDLNGDNKADVIITTQICAAGTCTYTASAVRGYDGVELWNKSSSGWMQATSAGDLNGDNKVDVIIINQSYSSGISTYTTTAVRGYDGVELWNKTISGSSVSMYATSPDDFNGDNKADVIITNQSYNSVTSTYTYNTTAVRGYDGAELWSKTISGSNLWVWAGAAGDLNNDLKGDALINTNYWSPNNYKLSTVNGMDGSEFFRVEANTWLQSSTANFTTKRYDLNGNGGDDILVWTSDNIYALSAQPYQGSSIGYSALVATGQNTYVQSTNGTFGLLLKGQTKTINNSVLLNNTGDISARVEARFNDSIGGVFGLISGANVLNATNFALGLPGSLVPLNNSGANVQVAVAPPGVTAMDARLGVPSDAIAGDYSGTVVLTFSNNV